MTEEEYKSKVALLKKSYEESLKNLALEFANANSSVNLGDIVEDHIGRIKVEKVNVAMSTHNVELPRCVYYGVELDKNGRPKKNDNKRSVWQCNLVCIKQ